MRWLRGEFSTKTEARQALGVRTIVDDENVYDVLKLLARFVKLAGYDGLLVCLDEMVNLYKLQNTRARNTNYERILTILNDSLQGTAVGMGFILCGTPEFLLDARRGLYSYEALQSRLAENRFAVGGLVDFSGPVLRLANLTRRISSSPRKLRHVFAAGEQPPPDDGLKGFMAHCLQKIGRRISDPAGTITAFVNLLSVIEQNPGTDWKRRRQVETPRRGRTAHSTKSRRRQPPPQTPPRPGERRSRLLQTLAAAGRHRPLSTVSTGVRRWIGRKGGRSQDIRNLRGPILAGGDIIVAASGQQKTEAAFLPSFRRSPRNPRNVRPSTSVPSRPSSTTSSVGEDSARSKDPSTDGMATCPGTGKAPPGETFRHPSSLGVAE